MQRQHQPGPPPNTRATAREAGARGQRNERRGSRSGVPRAPTSDWDFVPFTVTERARVLEPVTRDPFIDGLGLGVARPVPASADPMLDAAPTGPSRQQEHRKFA